MTPKKVLKLIKDVLKTVDPHNLCKATIKSDYLIEYGRSGRKTWAVEVTTTADEYYVAYVYPSNHKDHPWASDVGWKPKPETPSFKLTTNVWESLGDAVSTALTSIAQMIIITAITDCNVDDEMAKELVPPKIAGK